MENAFIINDLMNTMLTAVEENLSADSFNAIQQQTSFEKANEIVVHNDDVPTQTSELCSGNKTESIFKNEFEFLNVPSLVQKKRKGSLITEDSGVVKDCDTPLNIEHQPNLQKVNDIVVSNVQLISKNSELSSSNKTKFTLENKPELLDVASLIQNERKDSLITGNFDVAKSGGASLSMVSGSVENNEVENNISKNELKNDIVSIDAAKDVTRIKSESSIELSTELEKKRNFDMGDNGALLSVKNKDDIMKLEKEKMVDDKLAGKEKKLIEVFSFSSFERELTPDYESLSDDSEFFLTKSIESHLQLDTEICSSVKTSNSNISNTFEVINERKNKSKSKKFRWFRSNRVSPDQLQPEVKTKSKAKRLASSFAKGLRNSFNNVRKAYKSRRRLNLMVLCPLPFFMHL